MSKVSFKFAVSGLAIGATMVACSPSAEAYRPATASSARASKADQQASTWHARAQAAVQKGSVAEALPLAERAVELSPRDVGFRMLLADLYLKNGRFQSAEATFSDILQLDPANVRASLSIALSRIGQGRTGAALDELDRLSETGPAADVGLAYALAGQPERGIALLEPAARAPGAHGRVRQNLALAYAIAGDWDKARVTAAQDISPAELEGRLQQWAALARPSAPHTQVAALLGVTPVLDPGQPAHLALSVPGPAPAEAPATRLASAEPPPQPQPEPIAEAQPAPTQLASVEIPQWVSERATAEAAPEPQAEVIETRPVYAEAVQALVTPQPNVLARATPRIEAPAERFEKPRPRPQAPKAVGTGRFAVQLGAFGSAAGVERAWAAAYKRYGFGDHTPLSTTVKLPKGTFHRLAVAGFESHAEASEVCRSVRAKGGACFVRPVAGDAPVQWASRYATGRRA